MQKTLPDGRHLILASTSPYRRELLSRLGLPFETMAPEVNETPLAGERPEALVARLAKAKAFAVANRKDNALIIGSDQVAVLEGEILGKPIEHRQAVAQLTKASGKTVSFLTGLCLADSNSARVQLAVEPFRVVFRTLSHEQISNYLLREKPSQCAGSFKSEGLGIALFDRLAGDDPNSLIGLPLIRLIRMLEDEGIRVL